MEHFLENGHLSDEALAALATNAPLPQVQRLELAEHLAYCDQCLLRYTALLPEEALLTPETSCELGFWRRVRQRTLRMMTSRWTAAAAAVAIVFSLWGFGIFGGMVDVTAHFAREQQPRLTEELQAYPQRWSDAVGGFFEKMGHTLNHAFDGQREPVPNTPSGGN